MTLFDPQIGPDLPPRLAGILERTGPRRAARSQFAPPLSYGRHHGPPPAEVRRAAVLLVLFQHEGEWRLPLTVRQHHLADHAGQISLPGGMLEPQEASRDGALRELAEELGVDLDPSQIVGSLPPLYVFNSNFLVTPWVGCLPERPPLRPNAAEVADVFEVSVAELLDSRHSDQVEIVRGGLRFVAPCFRWEQYRVWGATGMILSEFRAVLQELLAIDT